MSKLFLYLKTDTFRKNLIIALIFIVVLFLFVYFGLRMYTKHGDAQEVPVLKGLHISEAMKILDKAGLNYEVDSIYQLDAKPGLVIEQDPEEKSHVKGGRTVYLTIITQIAPEIAFPDIVDKTLIEASAIIKNHSLKLGDTIYIADIARDVVLDAKFGGQSVEAGRMISKGSRIDLVLGNGRGSNEVEVPLLIGFTLSEAKFALTGVGLNIGKVSYSGTILDSLSAKIITQTPDTSSALISIGSLIDVTLSN
ncbi:PASTA domain-containing protein [Sphingobacterium hungaricum]